MNCNARVGVVRRRPLMVGILALVFVVSWSRLALDLEAQLAITEVMASPMPSPSNGLAVTSPDFWELTNYGTNAIDLAGYYFSDGDGVPPVSLSSPSESSITIQPSESIIFAQYKPSGSFTNEEKFQAWWGSCMPQHTRVYIYGRTPGFASTGDGLHLYDSKDRLIDYVRFGISQPGVSFISDPQTGEFGVMSTLGVCGTCRAALSGDVGSPGQACPQIPLRITHQPQGLRVCMGGDASFVVQTFGLPRAHFQWYHDDVPIQNAEDSVYRISLASPGSAGRYSVLVSNGISSLRSADAVLEVDSTPMQPTVILPPGDLEVQVTQTAHFRVQACASPPATFEWSVNDQPVLGQTGPELVLYSVSPDQDGSRICVRLSNEMGSTNLCAQLTVRERPTLVISEIQTAPTTNCLNHQEWFEVSNLGTNLVNLQGYKFWDSIPTTGPLEPPFVEVVQESVPVQPGESVIFAKRMTRQQFVDWWGIEQLPPDLKVVTYSGFSMSSAGDTLFIWSKSETDSSNPITATSFSQVNSGISQFPDSMEPGSPVNLESEAGQNGAFVALQCGDIGSPGDIANPSPRILSILPRALGLSIRWRAEPSMSYRLESTDHLEGANWSAVGVFQQSDWIQTHEVKASGKAIQFYRLIGPL